jgi:predicted membrane protein
MRLVNLVIALIVVGVALWLINRYIPRASSIKTILNVVVVVAGWDLGIAGGWLVGIGKQSPAGAMNRIGLQ